MASINSLLAALDEREIAQRIGIPHDEARMRYALHANTVAGFREFEQIIGEYYNYHFTTCVAPGGALSPAEARSRAKQILEQDYRRRNGDIRSAFVDARDGTNGGLRAMLDIIAEALKADSMSQYTQDVFDRHVTPVSWEEQVDIMRQFIAHFGAYLGSSIRQDRPEQYARDYEPLIRSYVRALQQTSSMFRRL